MALGFLAYSCPGAQAFSDSSCIGVLCSCSQSICQLPIVSYVLLPTFFVSLQHPTAWGCKDEGPHLQRASCLICWHLEPSLQGVCLPSSAKKNLSYSYLFPSYPQNKRNKM